MDWKLNLKNDISLEIISLWVVDTYVMCTFRRI